METIASLRNLANHLLEGKGDVSELALKGNLLILELKKANRQIFGAMEGCKEEVTAVKVAQDKHHLLLQNLLYEKNHLLREIQTCTDFT